MLWLIKDTLAKWKILGLYLSGGAGREPCHIHWFGTEP